MGGELCVVKLWSRNGLIAGHPARDLDIRTWYSILEQAGLDREEYR